MSIRRPPSLALALFATVLIAGSLGACKPKPTQASEEAKVDALISDPATGSPTLRELKAQFPEEYSRLRTELGTQLLNGATNDGMKLAVTNWQHTFFSAHQSSISKAPDAAIHTFALAFTAVLKRQQELNFDCDMILSTGFMATQPSGAARPVVEDLNVATIKLMKAAATSPTERERPRRDDVRALKTAMRDQGATADQADDVIEGGLGRISADDRCMVAGHLYAALAALPDDQAGRLFAAMMAG